MPFLTEARAYFAAGYTPIPLGLDASGRPKKPLPLGWTSFPHDWPTIEALPWDRAAGLGLPLGNQASGVAAIDVDDVDLGHAVAKLFYARHTRLVETIRKRLHVYVREDTVSQSTNRTVLWQGREVKIELRTTGNQVAAPPTPGYTLLDAAEPLPCPTILAAWNSICQHLGIELAPTPTGAGYPRPWKPTVGKEERNKAAYVEAHTLRKAGATLESALGIMQARFDRDYEPGEITWREIERTVKSAFAKEDSTKPPKSRYQGFSLVGIE